jgi:hypothetical protein
MDVLGEYFRLRWRVIPLKGKRPFIEGWQNLKLTPEEFKANFREGDNVGVITGWLKEGELALVALDVDEPKVLAFDFDFWIASGAIAHTTSTGKRIVFYTDSAEVASFSRKVAVKPEDLTEEEKQLIEKAKGKESITLIEVLAEGRQFMAPPSVHPETGQRLEWVVGPVGPRNCLVVHSLEELKQLLTQSIHRSKWVVEELFETSRLEAKGDMELLQGWLVKILDKLKPYLAGETPRYFTFHCPFHGPDRNPSFAINKLKFYAFDYHDGEAFSLKQLAEKLGVELKETRGDVIEAGEFNVKPLFNGLSVRVHPAVDVVGGLAVVGVTLPCLVTDKEGKQSEKELPFFITSDRRRILCNPKVLGELKWRLTYKIVNFENRWSLNGIKAWLEGGTVNPRDVYFNVKKAWESFLEFPEPRVYKFISLWSVGTYFFHLFESYPYVLLYGLKRTGKTRTLTVASLVCFNAIFSNNISTSSLFRLIQSGRCTLLLDEAENLAIKERVQELRNLLLAGYKRGAKVWRTEKTRGERLVPEQFEVYSPKMLANIQGFEDVLADRGITIIMKRCRNRNITDKEPKESDKSWQEIRDSLHMLYLQFASEVSAVSEVCVVEDANVSERELELWRPIFALAKFFDKYVPEENLVKEMAEMAKAEAKEKQAENVTETPELLLVQTLMKTVEKEGFYKVKDIVSALTGMFDEDQKWLNTRWCGRALKRLGLVEDKRRVGSGVEVYLKPEKVKDAAERLGCIVTSTTQNPQTTQTTPPLTGQTAKPIMFYKHVKPAEPCEVCGQSAVEWEIKTPSGEVLRRCNSCFAKMQKMMANVEWCFEEEGEGFDGE